MRHKCSQLKPNAQILSITDIGYKGSFRRGSAKHYIGATVSLADENVPTAVGSGSITAIALRPCMPDGLYKRGIRYSVLIYKAHTSPSHTITDLEEDFQNLFVSFGII